jgi:hypothetical protein
MKRLMRSDKDLFNIFLLKLTKIQTQSIGRVTELMIHEPNSMEFNHDGLFSTKIFGNIGGVERNEFFGYIDLNTKILHPLIFKHLISLGKLYRDIAYGTVYAKFDEKINDFVISNEAEGSTGYNFLFKNYKKIKFNVDGVGDERRNKINMINGHNENDLVMEHLIVYPAGLRDYMIDEEGNPSEDEVNGLYRRVLAMANSLENIGINSQNSQTLDKVRLNVQLGVVAIHDHFIGLLDGKKKHIQNGFTKRGVEFSTRNVITPIMSNITDLTNTETLVTFNRTVVGLFQYSKAIHPITMNRVMTTFIKKVFNNETEQLRVIDKDTLNSIVTQITFKDKEKWYSDDGIAKMMNKLSSEEMRGEYVKIGENYLCLLYDDGEHIIPVFNTNEFHLMIESNLTSDEFGKLDKKHLRPIKYYEMIYLSIFQVFDKYPATFTRYPVANIGGIYPTKPYVKSTIAGRKVKIYDEHFNLLNTVYEYPDFNSEYYNSLSPATPHLDRLGGDYDGDKSNFIVLFSEEAVEEVNNRLNSKTFYITPAGEITYSVKNTILDITFKTLTE